MGKAEVLTEVKFWFIHSSVHLMQSPAEASDSPTRARILAAAEERFAAFGYRRTGIAEIARDAGVAPGTLYRYFENKEEIFRAVMREGLASWLETSRSRARVIPRPRRCSRSPARSSCAASCRAERKGGPHECVRRRCHPHGVAAGAAHATALAEHPLLALALRDGRDGGAPLG